MKDTRYWIIVASGDHVKKGVAGGFAQACHGQAKALQRMHPGDYIIYYSGKEKMDESRLCQKFTAIGKVRDQAVYAYSMTPEFCPFRRDIKYLSASIIDIRPLIPDLDFIKNKQKWGYPFRFGVLQIDRTDFERITSRMLPGKWVL